LIFLKGLTKKYKNKAVKPQAIISISNSS